MKGIILYKSKYGATKKYADWLADSTWLDSMETDKANISHVREYDVIVLGGGIYASGIAGLSFLKKNMSQLRDKKIIVFCDGASPYDEAAFQEVKALNMKNELADIPLFYCRGSWNMPAMGFVDKNLCKMLQKSVSKKDPNELAVWEKALLEAGESVCDWTNKAYLTPILNSIEP